MATIIQRGDKWRAQIRLKGVSRSATFERYTDAKAWAARIETQINDGVQGNAPRYMTFGDLLQKYMDEELEKKNPTRHEKNRIKSFLESSLARVPLTELRPLDFANWRDERLKTVKGSTVNRELGILSGICEHAVKEWGLMHENPTRKIKKPKNPKERSRRPTGQEINDICAALMYDPNIKPTLGYQRVAIAFLFAIETAMRAGEICGLTWDNVSFERRLAHLPITKNGHSRDVPLSKRAIELLHQLKDIDTKSVFLLASPTLDACFRRARDRCGIKDLHFHDSRREALTRMSKKVPVEVLAKISGHRSLSILLNVYYRPDMADVADLLD